MHPYRVPPEPPAPELPQRMPPEERFLIGLLIVIGGIRVIAGILAGGPFDGEALIGLGGFVLGCWWGLRAYRGRSCKMHERSARDRARGP